jgi:hypothetical protein
MKKIFTLLFVLQLLYGCSHENNSELSELSFTYDNDAISNHRPGIIAEHDLVLQNRSNIAATLYEVVDNDGICRLLLGGFKYDDYAESVGFSTIPHIINGIPNYYNDRETVVDGNTLISGYNGVEHFSEEELYMDKDIYDKIPLIPSKLDDIKHKNIDGIKYMKYLEYISVKVRTPFREHTEYNEDRIESVGWSVTVICDMPKTKVRVRTERWRVTLSNGKQIAIICLYSNRVPFYLSGFKILPHIDTDKIKINNWRSRNEND